MLRVGLTGNLGSGKTTVAGYLRELGAEVIEADVLGRALMEPGESVYAAVVDAFGPGVVNAEGRLSCHRKSVRKDRARCHGAAPQSGETPRHNLPTGSQALPL